MSLRLHITSLQSAVVDLSSDDNDAGSSDCGSNDGTGRGVSFDQSPLHVADPRFLNLIL